MLITGESAIATLSTGIVGIGDKIGMTNLNVISRSMRADGLILKPSRPLVVPDYLVWELDTVGGTTEYETWSEVAGNRFGIIYTIQMASKSNTSPGKLSVQLPKN